MLTCPDCQSAFDESQVPFGRCPVCRAAIDIGLSDESSDKSRAASPETVAEDSNVSSSMTFETDVSDEQSEIDTATEIDANEITAAAEKMDDQNDESKNAAATGLTTEFEYPIQNLETVAEIGPIEGLPKTGLTTEIEVPELDLDSTNEIEQLKPESIQENSANLSDKNIDPTKNSTAQDPEAASSTLFEFQAQELETVNEIDLTGSVAEETSTSEGSQDVSDTSTGDPIQDGEREPDPESPPGEPLVSANAPQSQSTTETAQEHEEFKEVASEVLATLGGISPQVIATLSRIPQKSIAILADISPTLIQSLSVNPYVATQILRQLQFAESDASETTGQDADLTADDSADFGATIIEEEDHADILNSLAGMSRDALVVLAALKPEELTVLASVPQQSLQLLANVRPSEFENLSTVFAGETDAERAQQQTITEIPEPIDSADSVEKAIDETIELDETGAQALQADDELETEPGQTLDLHDIDDDLEQASADPDAVEDSNKTVALNAAVSSTDEDDTSELAATIEFDEDGGFTEGDDGQENQTLMLDDPAIAEEDNHQRELETFILDDDSPGPGDDVAGTIELSPSDSENDGEEEASLATVNSSDSSCDSLDQTTSYDPTSDDSIDQTHITEELDDDSLGETIHSDDFDDDDTIDSATDPQILKTINDNFGSGIDSSTDTTTTIRGAEDSVLKDLPKTSLVIKQRSLANEGVGEGAEYELISKLGEGGMGIVWYARQNSVYRDVAIKMLKPKATKKKREQQKFLAEAVVTGDLDHPNIVPIYDVGTNQQGALFYSMKKVEGTPWLKCIRTKPFQENIEILLKVTDAVAFAHARGVVHRDLKPENVMLGDFGEVLVMDWGLAHPTHEFSKRSSIRISKSLGGTPAYMAPEMATGPIAKIGPASDVYLLGAILFEILTGRPPHTGKNTTQCLYAAIKNKIRATRKTGELINVSMKAMATEPENRYASAQQFKDAVNEYLSHSESISMAVRAGEDLEQGKKTDNYEDFARARFGFQEAYDLWNNNQPAKDGIANASLAYAQSAKVKGDFDLATTLLDQTVPAHAELLNEINAALNEREARIQRLRRARQFGVVAAAFFLIVVSGAAFWINVERNNAVNAGNAAIAAKDAALKAKSAEEEAKDEAQVDAILARVAEQDARIAQKEAQDSQKAEEAAKDQEVIARKAEVVAKETAQEKERIAVEAKKVAIAAEKTAVAAEKVAVAAKQAEEYESYIARIGLAAAKIDENSFRTARLLLLECIPKEAKDTDYRDWEWGRLMHLCSQSDKTIDIKSKVNSVRVDEKGELFAVGGEQGLAEVWNLETQTRIARFDHGTRRVNCIAISNDRKWVATASDDKRNGFVRLWEVSTGKFIRKFAGHSEEVLSVVFSKDGSKLLTSSRDKTARLWNTAKGTLLATLRGHTYFVWSAAFSDDEKQIVTCGQDGIVVVWEQQQTRDNPAGEWKNKPPFSGHDGPVYSAAFSPDGDYVVSAGYDRRVLIWKPENLQPRDFENVGREGKSVEPEIKFRTLTGHTALVRRVAFFQNTVSKTNGASDQKHTELLVLSCGNDNTIKVWNARTGKSVTTFRGHDQEVQACVFSPDGTWVLSGSHDSTVKKWTINEYEEIRTLQGRNLDAHDNAVLAAEFSGDGRKIVTASQDRTAKTWDSISGSEGLAFREGHRFLASTAVFLDDRTLLTAAVDNTVRVWDVSTATERHRLNNTGRSAALAVLKDKGWVLTGSDRDKTRPVNQQYSAKLWDVTSPKQPLRIFAGHSVEVTAVAISPDGRLVVTGDAKGNCQIWDAKTGSSRRKLAAKGLRKAHEYKINQIVFTPDGKSILTASNDFLVSRWDSESGREMSTFRHKDEVSSIDINRAGTRLASASRDGFVRLWNLTNGKQPATFDSDPSITKSDDRHLINKVEFSADDRTVLIVDLTTRTVQLVDAETLTNDATKTRKHYLDFKTLGGRLWSAAFSPDGDHVVTVGGADARLWTLPIAKQAPRQVVSFSPHGTIASASFSRDGKRIVTGSWDTSARVWDATTGKSLLKLDGHTGYVNSVSFSPDPIGKYVLTASDDGTAKLWRSTNANVDSLLVSTFKGHRGRVLRAVFSHDGTLVLTASSDRTFRIWKVDPNKAIIDQTICTQVAHEESVLCAVFATDSTELVLTGSEDTTAKLWNLAWNPDRTKCDAQDVLVLQGHTASVTSVAFSPNNRRMLTGSEDYIVKLWDTKIPSAQELEPKNDKVAVELREVRPPFAQEILSLKQHTREVTSVAFSPKTGQYVLSGSRDGTAILWLAVDWKDRSAVASRLLRK